MKAQKFDTQSLKEEMVNLGLAKMNVDYSIEAIEKAESIFTEKEIEANGAILSSLWNGENFVCGFLTYEGEKQIEWA